MAETSRVDQIRQRVVQTAQRIEHLSQSDLRPDEFFPEFLQLLVKALGASAGAVWTAESSGRINLTCDVALAETGLLDDPVAGKRNHELIASATLMSCRGLCKNPSNKRSFLPQHRAGAMLGCL